MNIVGLISGGKDGIFNLIKCVEYGHNIVCLANLHPPAADHDELNSHMFQTVGHELITAIAECMELPLIRQPLHGKSLDQSLHYQNYTASDKINPATVGYDEIMDLLALLSTVKEQFPHVNAVACGAILSSYQRIRVESVCRQLGLKCLAYLWHCDQVELLREMNMIYTTPSGTTITKIDPVLIKIATSNMDHSEYLTRSLTHCTPQLMMLYDDYGMNVCGEGGEYESLVLNCCLFTKSRINITKWRIIEYNSNDSENTKHITVPYAYVDAFELIPKTDIERANDASILNKISHDMNCPVLSSTVIQCSCQCIQFDNTCMNTLITPTPLPSQQQQLDLNLTGVNATQLIAKNNQLQPTILRCFLRSNNINELLSTVKSYETIIFATFSNTTIRPLFVSLCIPDMTQFGQVNTLYSTTFPQVRPAARICVQSALPYYSLDVIYTTTATQQHIGSKLFSHHVEAISTWAPANIGPYSQFWRLNGLFIGAGQIGMHPASMDLYNCLQKQFLQTIRNAVSCFQSACDIHIYNHILHSKVFHAKKVGSTSLLTPSLGQFTSLLLMFDASRVNHTLATIVNNFTEKFPFIFSKNDGMITQYINEDDIAKKLAQIELILAAVNRLATITSEPLSTPTTTLPSLSNILFKHNPTTVLTPSDFMPLLNKKKETHMKWANTTAKHAEMSTIFAAIKQNTLYLPPIITEIDTEQYINVNKNDNRNGFDNDNDDPYYLDEDDLSELETVLYNTPASMIILSAEALPRYAAFELCPVGLTQHVFKAMSERGTHESQQYGSVLSTLRHLVPSAKDGLFYILHANYIRGLYCDATITVLFTPHIDLNVIVNDDSEEIRQVYQHIYELTQCNPFSSDIAFIQSQAFFNDLFFTSQQITTDPTSFKVYPTHSTMIYPMNAFSAGINANIAQIHMKHYRSLLNDKMNQITTISDFIDANTSITQLTAENSSDIFYPRPKLQTCHTCQKGAPCGVCTVDLEIIHNSQLTSAYIIHFVIGDVNQLSSVNSDHF